jgi:ubiquinone/menaquinone biosynthesis C-methylase UbiE
LDKKFMNSFNGVETSAGDGARFDAIKLSLAPFAFQAARILRDRGILEFIFQGRETGKSREEIREAIAMNEYGIFLLLDAGESIGLVTSNNDRWVITTTGYHILHDQIAKLNMDFAHDICYRGLFYLEDSFDSNKPVGLKTLGDWETIYEGLAHLTEREKESWFRFDHFFSDKSFPRALSMVFRHKPATLLDIGGNTGKWALKCVKHDPDVSVTIMDLKGQVDEARRITGQTEYAGRIHFHVINILDREKEFPHGFDAIWMSQFLDCFDPDDIVSILQRARRALNKNGKIFIMETFVDNQRYEMSKYCLDMTSLYFTAMANGKSRMYPMANFLELIRRAGLTIESVTGDVGISHTVMVCT